MGATPVTITGTNLSGATEVHFGSTRGTITADSATKVHATSPKGTGQINVTVTTPGGTSAIGSPDKFTYTTVTPAPTVRSISPSSGPTVGGTAVTIAGTNFSGATKVDFGPTAGTITADSATSITARSPSGSGTVNVTVITAGGASAISSADQFTYQAPGVCTDTWTGNSSSSWSTAGNWSADVVPSPSSQVCIPAGTGTCLFVVHDGEHFDYRERRGLNINGTLDLTGSSSTSSGPLTVDGTLEGSSAVTVTGALTLDEGSLDGPGTVTVNFERIVASLR